MKFSFFLGLMASGMAINLVDESQDDLAGYDESQNDLAAIEDGSEKRLSLSEFFRRKSYNDMTP